MAGPWAVTGPADVQPRPAPVYRGRFAPSPTGPLHVGSLLTAVASLLDARAHQGQWQLRIDDLDQPRAMPGAEETILRSLEAHGLTWDGPVQRQSEHFERYQAALAELARAQRIFYCRCTRKSRVRGQPYPGTCRAYRTQRADAAVRFEPTATPLHFADRIQGTVQINLLETTGPYIIWRRDALPGYALATAVDDGADTVTDVVRGVDLLSETAPQLALMQALGLTAPRYAHLPVAVDSQGVKLSKQAGAAPLDDGRPAQNLSAVFRLLGVPEWVVAEAGTVAALWANAQEHWSPARLRGRASVPSPL
ncbi:MAG: tRNA glutamyl-Q(34) synthetase GluQRS [Pseudomonadota bacterium]